jgi:hypothetical protein
VRSDAELILASREDSRAFRELYDRWADELLAETFAVAFARRRRFRHRGLARLSDLMEATR